MEAFKVRLQTSGTPFCSGFVDGLSRIYRSEGLHGFYKGIVPLWMRQIPYTMVKFASFENIVAGIYHSVLRRPKSEFTKGQQLGVTCTAGYLAGILCAIVSHPADTIVSKLNSSAQGTSAGQIVRELGMRGLWAGLLPRIFMIGTLTCTQWTIYDSFKVKIGLPTTGDAASNNIYLLRSLDKCEQQLTTEPFNEPLDAQQVRRLVNIEHIANMAQSSLSGQEPGSDIERRATELKQRIAPWVERKNALVLQFTRPADSNSDFEDALVDEQTKGSRVSTPTARVDSGTTAMDRRNELLGETEGLRRRGVVPDNVAGVERLLKSQQETHDDLTAELSQMAQVLKENSLAFGKLVEDDKGLVEETTELLDRS
ncbi:Cu/Pi carrier, partial [Coemansia sp. RSA 551]